MATHFGEIVPVVSRAVEDDDDEDEDCDETKKPKVFYTGETCGQCRVNIIAIGPIANAFCRAYIFENDIRRMGTIFCHRPPSDEGEELSNHGQNETILCELHNKLGQEILFCLIPRPIQDEITFDLIEQIFSLVNPDSTTLIMCNEHVSRFYSSNVNLGINDEQPPFTRCLKSTKYCDKVPCSYLGQPNIITGIAAGLLTHSQVHSKSCLLFICYTDLMEVDSVNAEAFLPLLKCGGLNLQANLNSKVKIKQFSSTVHSSNLYL